MAYIICVCGKKRFPAGGEQTIACYDCNLIWKPARKPFQVEGMLPSYETYHKGELVRRELKEVPDA